MKLIYFKIMKMITVSLFLIISLAASVNGNPCLPFGPLLDMMVNRAMGFRRIGPEPGVWYGGVPVVPIFGGNGGFIPVGNGGGDFGGNGGGYGYGNGGGGPVYQNGNGGYGYGGPPENAEFGRLQRG